MFHEHFVLHRRRRRRRHHDEETFLRLVKQEEEEANLRRWIHIQCFYLCVAIRRADLLAAAASSFSERSSAELKFVTGKLGETDNINLGRSLADPSEEEEEEDELAACFKQRFRWAARNLD